MDKLRKLMLAEIKAITATGKELEREFPVGTVVAFNIMADQINPSTGTVVSFFDGGILNIEHHEAKKHSRYSHRRVSFNNVVKI